jgi:CBS domain containing-hemolysin-like protein
MRYVQIRQNYSTAYSKALSFGATLIAFRDSRLNLFKAIKDRLSSLLTSNNNFNTQLGSFKTRVNQFYSAVSTLNNLITNPLSGLVTTSNCKTLSDKLKFAYNVFCVNFMGEVVKLALCCLILLVLMFGGVLAGSRFGMIYAEKEKVQRVMPE